MYDHHTLLYFSHRLYSHELTLEENKQIYGKCINQHGHNYVLEVSVKGAVDPKTGMFINITELKSIIATEVLDILDHRTLEDLEPLKGIVTTTENVAVWIWGALHKKLGNLLFEVKIEETEKNFVIYRGE
ncbi:6-pyruvoyltetrahydropterin synthase [Cavenderia fasciculata]|uniref:6-pyruvoyl tetrahydrobiopterin synthase n=1 Tax=Cavenderia fasciculata TaxID=261658 RepID=F4Q547_CACFS|nr:6-pyruvoyltetrahydropterin synthase [Cavenderia fasciculata]EGG17940.1 6-pyruvoyltetrahydropterin synthase [Cavenderia fasciculata]|eukprot:XP_004356424.1 6-pyruvoyltetrahydropterin synthase [Cavenderia fasciculata]